MDNRERAMTWYVDAVLRDIRNSEAFDALAGKRMMSQEQEAVGGRALIRVLHTVSCTLVLSCREFSMRLLMPALQSLLSNIKSKCSDDMTWLYLLYEAQVAIVCFAQMYTTYFNSRTLCLYVDVAVCS